MGTKKYIALSILYAGIEPVQYVGFDIIYRLHWYVMELLRVMGYIDIFS